MRAAAAEQLELAFAPRHGRKLGSAELCPTDQSSSAERAASTRRGAALGSAERCPTDQSSSAERAASTRREAELLERLRSYGLSKDITTLRLTRNRTVMVSFRGSTLRVHRAFLVAPHHVLRAVATFVSGRTRAERVAARPVLLAYPVPRPEGPARRREMRHPADAPAEARLEAAHRALNAERFNSALGPIAIRVSRRLKSRLGYYRVATAEDPAEIVISRRHIRRHGWSEALSTLLHEMVHQWQDESGGPVDHGSVFRRKARQVGLAAQPKPWSTDPSSGV
jgi:SprT-like family